MSARAYDFDALPNSHQHPLNQYTDEELLEFVAQRRKTPIVIERPLFNRLHAALTRYADPEQYVLRQGFFPYEVQGIWSPISIYGIKTAAQLLADLEQVG
jgi:hypothetical protein